jgi:cell division cycle 14
MLYLNRSPDEAYKPFKYVQPPFPCWHDATPGVCHFQLTVLDTLRGLYKARECGFFDFNKFNIDEYEHYEQVENGDLNWTLANKFIAFAGPHATHDSHPGGYTSLTPDDYVPYFKRKNVKLVVRLNKKYYDARKFTSQGIEHMELYFLDGSNPPDNLLARFLDRVENCDGAVAVHCKAGLGRTGCVVGCYMMKHYRCTAEEVIGWLRTVRPGSIIGPQQQWLKEMNNRMWREGDLYRSKRGIDGASANAGKGDVYANEALRQKGRLGGPAASSVEGISNRMQGMQVSNGKTADDEKVEAEGRQTQGDYLRQRRMVAAQELASSGTKKPTSREEAKSKTTSSNDGRFGRFFNSLGGK